MGMFGRPHEMAADCLEALLSVKGEGTLVVL